MSRLLRHPPIALLLWTFAGGSVARAMEKLGADANQVVPVFITLDPRRDTRALLSQYAPAFHSAFIRLMGRDGKYLGFLPPATSADRMVLALQPHLRAGGR